MKIYRKTAIAFFCILLSLLMLATPEKAFAATDNYVYLSGQPVGIELKIDGLIVAAKGEVESENGRVDPLAKSNVAVGDILYKVDGKKITTARQLAKTLNSKSGEVKLSLYRGDKQIETTAKVVYDKTANANKIGLFVKEDMQGVGTLTFTTDNNSFASLGHPVTVPPSKKPVAMLSGETSNCMIMGVRHGDKNEAGELKGVFIKDGELSGEIIKNDDFGVFGKLDKPCRNLKYPNKIAVANPSEVKTGKAVLVATVDGRESEEYEIEILSKEYQPRPSDKGMIIKVTDKRLLEKTGGIVQGMSGSPILQNGKLIGAVTHVFLNDSTKGYAIFSHWQLNNIV